MNQQQKFIPAVVSHFINNTNDMSTAAFNITPTTTTMITNHNNNNSNDEQCTTVLLNSNERTAMKTTNVNDDRQHQRDREKGEREYDDDNDVKRTRQINRNCDSVQSSFTNEQYNCPGVNDSMANYLSSFKCNKIFLPNNYYRDYEPSYPSINRFQTPSSYHKTHYLDESDEEIIKDEILEIINLDHYPTLMERWGDDTKPFIRQQGELIIEDYVEFDEIESTITEEITYEFIYEGDQIKSTREIYHSRTESRNFRKIKKRRIKCKRPKQLLHEKPHSIINATPFNNINIIDEDISSQTSQSDDQRKHLFELIEHEINQSHISFNDISSRTYSSINKSNDKHTKISDTITQLISNDSKIKQEETPVQIILTEDEFKSSTLNFEDSTALETIEQNAPLLSNNEDNQVQFTHISTITKSEQIPIREEATVLSDSPTTSINIHLPSDEIQTEDVCIEEINDEKSNQDDNPSETISISTLIPEKDLCQQTLIPLKTEQDESVEFSLDSLADIIRQIITTTSTQLSSINPIEEIAEKSSKDSQIEIIEQSNILSTSTPSAIDFSELYQDHYVPFTTNEQTLLNFITIENEQLDEKTPTIDLSKIYYELREQRHIQSVLDNVLTEQKQETSDIKLPDQNENFDIKSFSSITNLPSREYHQVFGVSDDIINTINYLTFHVEQTNPFNEKSQGTETFKDHQSIVAIEQDNNLVNEANRNVELDLRYSLLLDRMNTLLKPLINSSSISYDTETESIPINVIDDDDTNVSISKSTGSKSLQDKKQEQSIDQLKLTSSKSSESIKEPSIITESIVSDSEVESPVVINEEINTKEAEDQQASATNQKESHAVFDLVVNTISNIKETISHFDISDEKIVVSMNASDKSNDTTRQLADLDHNQEQQTKIDTITEEINYNSDEKIVPIQEQVTRIPTQSIISNDPWFSSQYTVAATEFDRLSTTNLSPTIDYKEEDENEKKSSYQELQIVNDDYPWYSSYYTIVDAEAKFASEQLSLQTKVEFQNKSLEKVITENNELQAEQDNDDDDSFQIVQRRKRIPSSTTHEKTISSTITTTKRVLSPDIDLEPVVLHGHSNAPISVSPIIPQTTDITSKRKHKKKKDKNEIILFDAPEPTLLHSKPTIESTNSQIVEDEQQTKTDTNELQNEQDNDDDSFQIVQRRKRIPSSTTTHEKPISSTIITTKLAVSPDIDLEPVTLHGHPDAPISASPIIPQTTDINPKRKHKKKKDKNEIILFDAPEPALLHSKPTIESTDSQIVEDEQQTKIDTIEETNYNADEKIVSIQEQVTQIPTQSIVPSYSGFSSQYTITATEFDRLSTTNLSPTIDYKEEDENEKKSSYEKLQIVNDDYPWYSSYYTIVDAEAKFARLYKQLNISSEQLLLPTEAVSQNKLLEKVITENNESQGDQDNDDDDSFQIVQRRKRIPSSTTTHEKTISSTIITTKLALSPDIDLEPVTLHGHLDASIPASPIIPQTTDTTPKKKHKKKKKDKNEIILFDAPEPVLLHNKPTIESAHSQIVEDEQQTKIDTNELQAEQDNDDDDSFQIVQHRKRIPSSTTHEKTILSTIITNKLALSPDIDLEPVILHGHLDASIPVSPIIPQTTDTTPKKKHKKKKKDKNEIILFDAPEPTLLHSKPTIESTDSQIVEDEQLHLIRTVSSDDQKPEIMFNKEELTEIDNQKNELTSSDTSSLLSPLVPTLPKDVQTDAQLTEQQPTEKESIIESSLSSIKVTPKIIQINVTPSSKEEEDNEGFQLVRYRGRILSATKSDQIPPSKSTLNEISSLDVNQKTSVLDKQQNLPKPKKKRNKHKKQKKEINSLPNIDSNKVEQEPVNQETILQSDHISSSSDIEESNVQSHSILPSTVTTTTFHLKPSVLPKEEVDDDDNEGFQVVTYRKRITSAPRFANTSPLPLTESKYERKINRDIDPRHVVLHGRHGSTSPSIPGTTVITKTASNKQQPSSSFNTRPQSVSAETQIITSTAASNSLQTPKDIKQTIDQSSLKQTSTKKIVKEHYTSTKQEISTTNQPSSTALNVTNTNIEKSTLTEKKNDLSLSSPALEIVIPQDTTETKKLKMSKGDTHSSITTSIDLIQLSVEETIDRQGNNDTQQTSELQLTPVNTEQTTLINSTSETVTSPTIESIYQMNDVQNELHSIQSIASSASAIEEMSNSSKDLSITNQIDKEELTKESTNTSNKKVTKRRKKKSHTKQKTNDENVLTSSTTLISKTTELDNVQQIEPTTISSINLDVDNKLDLFLPEYIRQQINTSPTTTTTTSSDTIEKKKLRSKMLTRDHEVQSLLTNEFDDHTLHTKKQQITSLDDDDDDDDIDDDDEFIVQPTHSTEQNINNILSSGFYRWLQESQAISQQKDNLTNIMQNIVIQSSTITDEDEDEDEDSYKPTYMIGIHPNKQIHINHAYFINQPETISTSSLLITQSNKNTFQDRSKKFNSNNQDNSINNESTHTHSNSNQSINLTTNNKQQNLGENLYHQSSSINFDDWAHFLEDKTTYHIGDDLSPSLECFYTRTFDDDTLLSDTIPIHHSIKNQQQRYGDFLSSNDDNTPTIEHSLHKTKPSEYFQNWQKQQQQQNDDDDDEIIISHSTDGLSRRVRL